MGTGSISGTAKELSRVPILASELWRESVLAKEFSRETDSAEKKIKFDNVFDAQKAQGLKGRDFTVSLALAGSILDNAQSSELRTYLGEKY